MAEALRPAGYFTAMTGKWHLGQQHGTPPWERGFDRSLNSVAGGIYYPGQRGRQKDKFYLNGRGLPLDSPELGKSWYSTDLWTEFGCASSMRPGRQKKPFFLYLAHNAPHFPLMAPRRTSSASAASTCGVGQTARCALRTSDRQGLIDPSWKLSERPPDSRLGKAWARRTKIVSIT